VCWKPVSKIWYDSTPLVKLQETIILSDLSRASTEECGTADLKCGIPNDLIKFKNVGSYQR